jgi:hypothetical protein
MMETARIVFIAMASTMELAPMNPDLYEFLLAATGWWWTHSKSPYIFKRGKHVVAKHRARAIAVRYFLTHSGKGL